MLVSSPDFLVVVSFVVDVFLSSVVPSSAFCCALARAAANAAAGDGRLYDLWIPNIFLLPSVDFLLSAVSSFVKSMTSPVATRFVEEEVASVAFNFRFLLGRVCCCACGCDDCVLVLLNVNPPTFKVDGVFMLEDEFGFLLPAPPEDDDDGGGGGGFFFCWFDDEDNKLGRCCCCSSLRCCR